MNNNNTESKSLRSTLLKISKKKLNNEELQKIQDLENNVKNLTVSNNLAIQATRRQSKVRRPSDTQNHLITINKEGVVITREISRSHEVRSHKIFFFLLRYYEQSFKEKFKVINH
jgi:hypothetical protein